MRIAPRSFDAARASLGGWRGAGWLCAVASALALRTAHAIEAGRSLRSAGRQQHGHRRCRAGILAGRATRKKPLRAIFLTHYLTVCERFNFATAESDYEECGAFHSAQRNQAWYALWTATNPASPLNVHKDGSTRPGAGQFGEFLHPRERIVRPRPGAIFESRCARGAGADESFTHWVATIQYAYAEPAKDPKTRRWNPLGFKIIDFRSEPEVLSEPAAVKDTQHMEAR